MEGKRLDGDRTGQSGYGDLRIYQEAHRLAVRAHEVTLNHLPGFERYEEGRQLRRAAKSVCANIVEGYGGRRYKSDFLKFLTYAHASCEETLAHLRLLVDTGSLARVLADDLLCAYDALGAQINAFIVAVQRGHRSGETEATDE